MTLGTGWRDSFLDGYGQGSWAGDARRQRMLGGLSLACVTLACGWMLWTNFARTGPDLAGEPRPVSAATMSASAKAAAIAKAYAKLSAGLSGYMRRSAVAFTADMLFDARHPLGFAPGTFVRSAPAAADNEAAASAAGDIPNVETPSAGVSGGRRGSRFARNAAPTASQPALPPVRTANAPAAKPSIFEKLLGKPAPVTLAYAAPEDGAGDGPGIAAGRYDRTTAVYDISAHTVYLPDGTKLEAHSGFGDRLDDPRHTDERMRGATPATVYDLEPRESLFHGVRALRLIPVDDDKVFGRTGLLAHTYMLGPNGDSNGCVSFRNYEAFLRAYMSGEIKRLAVVARLE